MLVKTKAIVINSLRFKEKSLIVKCFTKSSGLKSYFIEDAFSSRKGAKKRSYFQPLTLIEIEALHRNTDKLDYLKEIKIAEPYYTINTDIIKSAIAVFLSEVLYFSIKEEGESEELFSFLETSLLWLDTHDDIMDFHLILLTQLTKFLGFYPDHKNQGLDYFDLQDGVFISQGSFTSLLEEETKLFKRLLNLSFGNKGNNFSVLERQLLLDMLMKYYSFHIVNYTRPNSLEVFKEVFH